MLNKKGFTIAEVLVSFSLIAVILSSVIANTMFYRDKLKEEEVKSQLLDYKTTISKIIYDDIIYNNIVKVETCIGSANCIHFVDESDNTYTLQMVEYNDSVLAANGTVITKRGVYLDYRGVKYMLPDSDLGSGYTRTCDFIGGINIDSYNDKLYKVKLSYRHKDMDINYDLLFIVG